MSDISSFVDDLRPHIHHLQALAAESYQWLKPEIACHLASEAPDIDALDHLLEQLYPAFSMGVDEGNYRALVAKLATASPEAAAFYEANFLEDA